jgi:DNA-binding CsgD family transcriptional regulator
MPPATVSRLKTRDPLPELAEAGLLAALEAIPGAALLVAIPSGALVHLNGRAQALRERDPNALARDVSRCLEEASPSAAPFRAALVRSASGPHALLVEERGPESELDARLARFGELWRLTPRGCEVLALAVRGEGNKAMARRLGLAERTIEVHMTSLFARAGVSSRAALVAAFWEARPPAPRAETEPPPPARRGARR